MNELLTTKEVSDYLKVSRTTVWRWCNDGKLAATKVGRGWRIWRRDLDRTVTTGMQLPQKASWDDSEDADG